MGIEGPELTISGGGIVNGSGITFFITGQFGRAISNIAVTGNLNLSAPSSGTYQGLPFIQERNLTYTSANTFSGSTIGSLSGTLYFPTTTLTYSGSATVGSYTAIIAKRFVVSGSASLKNDPTGMFTGLGATVRGLIQ